jgi:hypothetical protein
VKFQLKTPVALIAGALVLTGCSLMGETNEPDRKAVTTTVPCKITGKGDSVDAITLDCKDVVITDPSTGEKFKISIGKCEDHNRIRHCTTAERQD